MKLKRIKRDTSNDWQKCCRWCHYYKDGKCYNTKNNDYFESSVYKVSEEGYLSQTLEETLNDESLVGELRRSIESILDKWNISQKKKREFEEHFNECWSEFADFSLKESLDESVSCCYSDHIDRIAVDGVDIKEPQEYYCNEWC